MTNMNTPIAGDSDEYTLTSDTPELGDLSALIRSRGLNPDDWLVTNVTLNEWEGQSKDGKELFRQWKVSMRRKPALLLAAPASNVKPVKRRVIKPTKTGTDLVVCLSDHQAPYHDPDLHQASLGALDYFRRKCGLAEVIHLGDLIDLPSISRHPPRAADASVQACLNSGFTLLRDIAQVSGVPVKYIPGNHEHRLHQFLLNQAEKLYGVTPADRGNGELPALSLNSLLHLEELGVELCESPLGWEHSEVMITPDLVARHGWLTGQRSALRSLQKRGVSLIFGHLHRREHVFYWNASIGVEQQGICMGTMSLARDSEDYPSYTTCTDWTPGFCTVTRFEDGSWVVDHAIWNGTTLTWRDQQW